VNNPTTASALIPQASKVNSWAMCDVIEYLMLHSAEVLDYPPDTDTETMRAIDNANRENAIVYMAGLSENSVSRDYAARALDFVRS